MSVEKLVKNIKQKPAPDNLLVSGVVTSISPLRIKIDNRFEVGRDHLIIHGYVAQLYVGSRVRGIKVNNGNSIYVLERL